MVVPHCYNLPLSPRPGSLHTAELPCAGVQDRSKRWMACLKKGLPQLPITKEGIEAVLFPAESEMRIPVTPLFYDSVALRDPSTATQLLERADASSLVTALTALLDPAYSEFVTGHTSSHVIVEFIAKVFSCLQRWTTRYVRCSITLDSAEPCRADWGDAGSRLRPDTMIAMNDCTLLIGEHDWDSLHLAMQRLRDKRHEMDVAYYGQLRFLLAYAAAGKKFQWAWMPSNGKVSTAAFRNDILVLWPSFY